MPENNQLGDALSANYMLVDLQLRSWSGKRTDRGASDELLAQKQATKDGGAFVKNLLASAGQELKEVHTMGNALRTFVYNSTLPWSSSDGSKRGERMISTKKAMTFLNDLASLKREYDRAVVSLVTVWDQRVAEAVTNLGALGNPGEYPSAAGLPAMFAVSVDLKPIPAVSDFSRLNVPAELADALGQRHAADAETRVANAMGDLRDRFIAELERIERQLSKHGREEKTRLHDSLAGNMQSLVEMAKFMNITGNERLDDLVARIEQTLFRPVEAYRNSPSLAAQVAEEAKALAVEAAEAAIWN